MIYKDKYGRKVLARCDCGCAYIEVSKFDDDGDFYHYVSFYRRVNNLSLWDKLKVVKDILMGRDTLIQEIVFNYNQFKDFAEGVAALVEEDNG